MNQNIVQDAINQAIEPDASQNCYITIRKENSVMICFSLLHRTRHGVICGAGSSLPETLIRTAG